VNLNMSKIEFSKMVGSGNDFIVISLLRNNLAGLKSLARKICDRKYGLGADGLLVLDRAKGVDLNMRIFNADGSEAQMCGNGARCAALWWANSICKRQNVSLKIKTIAGIIESGVEADKIRIKLTDPKAIKMGIPLVVFGRKIKANFINTGVPHTVVFVDGLDKIDVVGLGQQIRRHKYFAPAGTNVNFVEVCANDLIKVRTYERGVEDETLACGTGSVASALLGVSCFNLGLRGAVKVQTQSGEILTVSYKKTANDFTDVWLEGKAKIICKGEYYLGGKNV